MNRMLNLFAIEQLFVALVILCLGLLHVIPSGIILQGNVYYAVQVFVCLFTIVSIPLSLKLMHFKRVKRQVAGNLRCYSSYSYLRMLLLSLSVFMGLIAYFSMGDNSMGWCALLAALSFVFIWPSKGRQEYETAIEEKTEE